jgi:hypothetical protein
MITGLDVIDLTTAPAPAEHRIGVPMTSVPMFKNDSVADCTFASQGHQIITRERSSQQSRTPTVSDSDVLAAYAKLSGYDGTPETDTGLYELDVMNYMRKVGLGHDPQTGGPHKIGGFARIHNLGAEFRAAHYMFGGLKVCAGLPLSARDEINAGKPWSDLHGALGEWGGHSMYSPGYNTKYIYVWTWSKLQALTWDWAHKFVDEMYMSISVDYLRGDKTPQGFDLTTLKKMLARLANK